MFADIDGGDTIKLIQSESVSSASCPRALAPWYRRVIRKRTNGKVLLQSGLLKRLLC